MHKRRCSALLILTALCVISTGCGREEPAGPDSAPFEAAIAAYCDDHHMDMEVAEFKSLTATAKAAMREKSALHNITITWEITFKLEGGRWKVDKVVR